MIKLGSESYPYLAVALHHNVDYAIVLRFSALMWGEMTLNPVQFLTRQPLDSWQYDAGRAMIQEYVRREMIALCFT